MRGDLRMPVSRLLVRGGAVGLILLVAALGTASAVPPAGNDYAPGTISGGGQHGSDTGHLPPVVKNMTLVSKLSPQLRGAIEEGQIADVSVYKGFAYLNSGWDEKSCKDGDGGTYVIDIRDPANPKEVGFLPALPLNYHGEGAHVITINTPQFSGDVLAVSNEQCTNSSPDKGGGFDLWNVTNPAAATRFNPPDPTLSWGDFGPEGQLTRGPGDDDFASSTHSVFMWDAGNSAYIVIVDNDEDHDVDIFDISNPASPQPVREYDLVAETPAWTETPNGDTPFHHDMVVKQIGGRQVLLASYWDAGYIQMDVTDPANATYMSDTDFTTSDPLTGFDPPEGNAHYAEYTNDNKYIVTAEEDFAPDRLLEITVEGVGTFEANAVGGGGSPNQLPDGRLNGPMAYGGYACPDSDPAAGQTLRPVPDAVTTFPDSELEPGEERILVVQRGPDGDSNEDYDGDGNITDPDDACFPGNKADRAIDAGWDAILIINRHLPGGAAADGPFCGSGGYTRFMVTACTTHEAGHAIFDDPAEYTRPYDDENELAPIGTESTHKLDATGTFDGWGYMGLYSTTPDENGKLPLVDAYAIPEALNPDYAFGFGDLSIHEQATDPTEPLSYSSYYAGGMRVFSLEAGKITPQGAFIDQGGNNFWGVEQFTSSDGERYIAGSDRDFGLYIFRYTGPLAAKRPVCIDGGAIVRYRSTGSVPVSCLDANAGNTLTTSVVSAPSQGTVTGIDQAADRATYRHTGRRLGTDTFTFKTNDGAADSATATARVRIVPGPGPRCFNPFVGTRRAERINGSRFGDRINARGGKDKVNGRAQGDCIRGGRGADRVRGGSGADRLFGNSGRDRLIAGSRRDRLNGGSGGDYLRGGTGNDRFRGGGGGDSVHAVDGWKERINCGGGEDTVRADQRDVVAANCETVHRIERKR
jgi:Big-like domain-containing protein/hemolysin type calcium-binding protein/LVIVD repeat-containing protein